MRSRQLVGVLTCALVAGVAWAQQAPAPQANLDGYAWSAECKGCHEAVFDAWSKTKHAKAIERFNVSERQADNACIGCHLTATKEPVTVDGVIINANVQCEGCHGPGKAHVAAAKAGDAKTARMVKAPEAKVCETCHNDKSPHFRGFYYAALRGLVHKH
jgi:hypothetical protein